MSNSTHHVPQFGFKPTDDYRAEASTSGTATIVCGSVLRIGYLLMANRTTIAAECETARMAALERLEALLGSGDGKATTRPDAIAKAARYSRIDTLFVTGDEHLWGTFDQANDRVVAHGTPVPGDIDLLIMPSS
jgi:hypothetical protein